MVHESKGSITSEENNWSNNEWWDKRCWNEPDFVNDRACIGRKSSKIHWTMIHGKSRVGNTVRIY